MAPPSGADELLLRQPSIPRWRHCARQAHAYVISCIITSRHLTVTWHLRRVCNRMDALHMQNLTSPMVSAASTQTDQGRRRGHSPSEHFFVCKSRYCGEPSPRPLHTARASTSQPAHRFNRTSPAAASSPTGSPPPDHSPASQRGCKSGSSARHCARATPGSYGCPRPAQASEWRTSA